MMCVLVLMFAFQTVKDKNKDFQVISATKQTSFGGVAGSPVSTNYLIKIIALRTMTLKADSIFAEGRIDRFYILKDSFNLLNSLKLTKGKTIEISVTIKSDSEMGGGDYQIKIPGSRATNPPFAVENSIIMRYSGGKNKYLTIRSVQKKPDILMP